MGRVFRFEIFFAALLVAQQVQSASFDTYVVPMASLNYPLYSKEYGYGSVPIDSNLRTGFRLESGRISDNIAIDLRLGSGSRYTDYGAMFRYFVCTDTDLITAFCPGLGLGASFSTGFPTEVRERKFFDVLMNPFVRILLDTRQEVGLVLEAGLVSNVQRSFSTDTPVADDNVVRTRAEVGVGIIMNFEKNDIPVPFSGTGDTAAPANATFAHFGLKGGFPFSKTKDPAQVTSMGSGVAGGLSLDLGAGSWGFMVDGLYVSRAFLIGTASRLRIDRIEIPAQIRFRTLRAGYIQTGFGGYYGLPVRNSSLSTGNVTVSVAESPGTADYGVLASFGFGSLTRVVNLSFELRFAWGLANQGSNTKSRFVDGLVGFMF